MNLEKPERQSGGSQTEHKPTTTPLKETGTQQFGCVLTRNKTTAEKRSTMVEPPSFKTGENKVLHLQQRKEQTPGLSRSSMLSYHR